MNFKINSKRLINAISQFSRIRVLVLGDIMLDKFIFGNMRRISPEAPVPIVQVENETAMLGGAANVLHNLVALGSQASLGGFIGNDKAGDQVLNLLNQLKIDTTGIIVCSDRLTTVKTRVVAHNQQIIRVDRESEQAIKRSDINRLLRYADEQIKKVDAVIVSDYAKGVVTARLMNYLRKQAKIYRYFISVDPKVVNIKYYLGSTIITPNHLEAASAANVFPKDPNYIQRSGNFLLKKLQVNYVLITQGKNGMTLFDKNGEIHISTMAKRIYDVTGAGDTVISTITLGLVTGLLPVEAAIIANLAAGIVIGEVGTSAITTARLTQELAKKKKSF